MKTIGLLGGMSWESSQTYYQHLNQQINQRLGGLHSAEIIMINVDFAPITQLMLSGDWQGISTILTAHCLKLQNAGADFIAIATNTMHKLASEIGAKLTIPLLHIADPVGQALNQQGIKKAGLLGTQFTMSEAFYKTKLATHYGIETLVPTEPNQVKLNAIIFDELCQGQLSQTAKHVFLAAIAQLEHEGAQAVVLACTEIGLLIKQADTQIPLIDATHTHIDAIVAAALTP